jgi:hypothetical protein
MVPGNQFFANLPEIINLSITDDTAAAAVCQYGLVTHGHIHNGKAGMTENDIAVMMNPPVIGPSVGERIQHSIDGFFVCFSNTSGYATHDLLLFFYIFQHFIKNVVLTKTFLFNC